MNPARFQRVKEVYLRVVGADAGQRAQALASECRGDDALAAEVRSLLLADGDQHFLAGPALGSRFSVAEAIARADGLAVGPYRTVAVLGAGTFGIVYRASQQDGPDVALKILRPGSSTPALVERFLREGATLRRLDHPGIARVLATGTTALFGEDVPWIAMELIAGQPLDSHVRQVEADVRQRLELVAALADAIQHAHELAIVHNDLKPENVLVTESGAVKVIDFGLAAFAGECEPAGGTLGYASPERWGRRSGGGAAADIWALGAIAYELVTGRLPFDWRHGRPMAAGDEVEAWPLGALRPELAGDLATVVHHALATDPRKRCPSAAFFAAELRRFLAGQPVQSPRPGPLRRMVLLARQHRSAAIGVATTFAALLLGILGTATGWANARNAWEAEQTQRAQAESSLAEVTAARERTVKANSVLTMLLRAPMENSVERRSGQEAVYLAAAKALTVEAAEAAGLQPAIFTVMASALSHLGMAPLAARQLEKAIIAHERAGAAPSLLAELRIELGGLLITANEPVAAEQTFRVARMAIEAMPAPPPRLLFSCILAQLEAAGELDNQQAMRSLIAEASAIVADRPASDPDCLRLSLPVARMHSQSGDWAAAATTLEASLPLARRTLGDNHYLCLRLTNELGLVFANTQQYDRADALYREAFESSRGVLAEDHAYVMLLKHNIGSLRVRQQRYDEAVAVLEPTVAARIRITGATHASTIQVRNSLAWAYALRGDLFAGESMLRQCLKDLRGAPEADDFLSKSSIVAESLAELLHLQGRDEEARPLAELPALFEASRHGSSHARFRAAAARLKRLRQG